MVVDKVVLVSRRGFSHQAAAKAKLNGVELLTLSEAKTTDWQDFLPAHIPRAPQSITLDIKPHVANLEVKALGKRKIPPGNFSVGRIICRCHRTDFGNPRQYADRLLKCHLLPDADFCARFNGVLEKQQKVCIRVGWPMAQFFLSHDGQDVELAQLKFHVHATHGVAPLEFKSYELQGDSIEKQMIQHASADVAGQKLQFVMPDGLKSKKIVLQFGNCDTK